MGWPKPGRSTKRKISQTLKYRFFIENDLQARDDEHFALRVMWSRV